MLTQISYGFKNWTERLKMSTLMTAKSDSPPHTHTHSHLETFPNSLLLLDPSGMLSNGMK